MEKIEFKPTHGQQTTIIAKNSIYEDTLAMVSYQFNGIHDEEIGRASCRERV